jgi:hypothetical protein
MGRILDLCSEIAESGETGPEGLVLPPDVRERLRADWTDQDIEDALTLVHENLLHSELVDLADSLSARLLELLGSYGEAPAFDKLETGQAVLTVDVIGQLARRVARLEEVLESYHDRPAPDRRGFDALQRRLADHGIEDEMERSRHADGDEPAAEAAGDADDENYEDDDR